MVTIKIIFGRYAGRQRDVVDGIVDGLKIVPVELLGDLAGKGEEWELDLSRATDEEQFAWTLADITVRIARALLLARPVCFDGKVYQAKDSGEVEALISVIEDDIAVSGYLIALEYDDESGVSISTHGRVQ